MKGIATTDWIYFRLRYFSRYKIYYFPANWKIWDRKIFYFVFFYQNEVDIYYVLAVYFQSLMFKTTIVVKYVILK